MRRLTALGFAVLVLVLGAAAAPGPAARATATDCGVTATPVRGSAPLTVTFTAACASSTYAWDFGDAQQGTGQSVQHAFAAGKWQPTLTTDTGTDTLAPVTSISVVLTGPRSARYAQWIALHVSVTPALPAEVRGHVVKNGSVRLRALGTAPYVAVAAGVRSQPLQVLLAPRITLSLRGSPAFGSPAHVVAELHPAQAGKVRIVVDGQATRAVDTRKVHVAVAVATSLPAPGWLPAKRALSVHVFQPDLGVGAEGAGVVQLESALAGLDYFVPPRNSTFSAELVDSVYAFQKINGLPRTGIADAATWRALEHPVTPRPRYRGAGLHVEVDKEHQVLYVVRDGAIVQISPVSTAGLPGRFTPVGSFAVYRKVDGFDPSPLGTLYEPNYFTGGYAIHGNPSVPPYPASHGCVRVPMWIAPVLFDELVLGTPVDVY